MAALRAWGAVVRARLAGVTGGARQVLRRPVEVLGERGGQARESGPDPAADHHDPSRRRPHPQSRPGAHARDPPAPGAAPPPPPTPGPRPPPPSPRPPP